MSGQPEHDQATSGQADSAADPSPPTQAIEAPVIRTASRSAVAGKGRGAALRRSQRKTIPAFDAAAINRLVDSPAAQPDSPGPASDAVASPPAWNGTEEPLAEQESSALEASDAEDRTETAPDESGEGAASGEPAPEPDVPVVLAAGNRDKKLKAARRPVRGRNVKSRRPWTRAFGWILLGVCGASALLVTVLLVNQSNRPARSGAAPPHEAPRMPDPQNASQAPRTRQAHRAPQSQPRAFSRTGVRPMDAAEKTRLRQGIDSFAEMGRAEEDKLHREKRKPNATKKPD